MATPPSDAIILFDGKDLSEWQSGGKGKKNVKWKIMDNFFEVKKGTGSIRTKKEFGENLNKGLFGIVQGGLYKDLRVESLTKLIEIGFD